MTPEQQIKCALKEGMDNIATAIFGENLRWRVEFSLQQEGDGISHYDVVVKCTSENHTDFSLKAKVPIRHPDKQYGNYRIDDVFFAVEAGAWAKPFTFHAWCENNPNLGAVTIVRRSGNQMDYRYLVAESMEGEVLLRGSIDQLPVWANAVLARHYDNLAA